MSQLLGLYYLVLQTPLGDVVKCPACGHFLREVLGGFLGGFGGVFQGFFVVFAHYLLLG